MVEPSATHSRRHKRQRIDADVFQNLLFVRPHEIRICPQRCLRTGSFKSKLTHPPSNRVRNRNGLLRTNGDTSRFQRHLARREYATKDDIIHDTQIRDANGFRGIVQTRRVRSSVFAHVRRFQIRPIKRGVCIARPQDFHRDVRHHLIELEFERLDVFGATVRVRIVVAMKLRCSRIS